MKLESELILAGKAKDYYNQILDFFAVQDPSSENPCWADFGELGVELDSLREFIAAV